MRARAIPLSKSKFLGLAPIPCGTKPGVIASSVCRRPSAAGGSTLQPSPLPSSKIGVRDMRRLTTRISWWSGSPAAVPADSIEINTQTRVASGISRPGSSDRRRPGRVKTRTGWLARALMRRCVQCRSSNTMGERTRSERHRWAPGCEVTSAGPIAFRMTMLSITLPAGARRRPV